MIVKVNVSVNHPAGLKKGSRLVPINALRFEDGEEVFRHRALSYGLPFLDMEGVMLYCLKYA